MRSHAFALLCWMSLLLVVLAGRGRSRVYHRGRYRPGHGGDFGGYGRGYGGAKGGRYHPGRNVGGRGGYGAPPPPTDECTSPCYRNYGLPGQEKCICPDTTTTFTTTTVITTTTPTATTATTPSTTTINVTPSSIPATSPTTTSPITTPRPCEPGPSCRPGFEPFERRCWRVTNNTDGVSLIRVDAEAECQAYSSNLASIRNIDDNEFVKNLTKKGEFMTYEPFDDTSGVWLPNRAQNHVHIGAYLPPGSTNWTWIDETPFSFSNWVTDYPGIYPSGGAERYGAILPDFDPQKGVWNDIGHRVEARKGVCVYELC